MLSTAESLAHLKRLTIGEMAALNHVTVKTLRVYHREGLLEPAYIDAQSGYRYYDVTQCDTLDAIFQMKQIGMSLDEIRATLKQRDVLRFADRVNACAHDLNRRIDELKHARDLAQSLLESCNYYVNPPMFGEIMLERFPERRIMRFPLRNPDMESSDMPARESQRERAIAIRLLKDDFLAQGLPPALFRNASCTIPYESLMDRSYRFGDLVIFVDEHEHRDIYDKAEVLAGGQYLTVYLEHALTVDKRYQSTALWLDRVLDYAEEKGFEIAGDYIGEVLAEKTAFLFESGDAMYRILIPVISRQAPITSKSHA